MKVKNITFSLRAIFLIPAVCFFSLLNAQIKVTGIVTSGEDKEPLIGVIIQDEANKIGTTTDIDGKFSITVPNESSVLNFSYLGMAPQKIIVGKQRNLTVIMTSSKTNLDELVVVGYGVMRRKDLTGSLSSVKGDELSKTKTTSFLEAMQGKMSGVQVTSSSGEPGAGVNITIRGGNSINAGTQPLYVIDGIQIDANSNEVATSSYTSTQTTSNPLAGINPSDILSLEVLKDASATAIYGSRGANGVIIITTKSGGGGEKTDIDLDVYWGLSSASKYIDVLQGQDYADYRFAVNPNGGYGQTVNGELQPLNFASLGVESSNWQKKVLRDALTQSYNLSITSGGKSQTKLAASFGYLNQQGIIIKNLFERYNARMRADTEINTKLSLGGNINFSHQIASGAVTSSGGNSYNGLIQSFVLFRPFAGNESIDESDPANNGGITNPVDFLNNSYKNVPTTRTMIDGYVQYKILDELIFRSNGGGMLLRSKSEEWYPSSTSWGYTPNGLAVSTSTDVSSWQNSNTMTFAKLFNKIHYLNIMVGFEVSKYIYASQYVRAEGFMNQSYMGIFDLGSASTYPEQINSTKESQTRESEFGRVNYSLQDKYLFTSTLRRDGSSKFGENNKYAYFPSLALAWKIHNEKFMSKQKLINELKYRISYGVTGNDRIPAYRSLSRMDKAYYPGATVSESGTTYDSNFGLAPSESYNPNLKWESTRQYNTGLDLQMFKGRLTLGLDLYYKQTFDMLLHADVPSQSGSYKQWQNLGQVDNKGIELTLGGKIIEKGDFSWSANMNFNKNKNKVISLGSVDYVSVTVAGGHITEVGRLIVGQPIGTGWGYVFDGVYQKDDFTDDTYTTLKPGIPSFDKQQVKPGDLKFKNLDGDAENKITPEGDKTIISNSEPKHFGGFGNNFNYKNFDATVFFQWSYGNEIMNIGRYRYEGYISYYNVTEDYYRNRWTETNPSNKYARIQGGGTTESSSYYVEDGSYLRLKNMVIGYTLPTNVARKLGIKNLRVYLSADNILTFTKYTGYDPEVSSNNPLLSGLDYTSYPRSRTFILGANIKF
ncbi:MAG: SusC/RagA family TonB-linked outer membrane protein [Dysgonomonas sp.]